MEKVLTAAKIFALCSLSVCLMIIATFFFLLPAIIENEALLTRTLIEERVESLEKTTNQQLMDWRQTTETQIKDLKLTADNRLRSIEQTADKRLSSVETQTMKRMDVLIASTDRNMTDVASGVNVLTQKYSEIPDRLESSIKPYTDCEENDFCWQNLATDSLVAVRQSSKDTSLAMQQVTTTLPLVAGDIHTSTAAFATQFPVIAQNVTNVTANIDRLTKPKWYDRLIGYAANGTLIWFNINRAMIPNTISAK